MKQHKQLMRCQYNYQQQHQDCNKQQQYNQIIDPNFLLFIMGTHIIQSINKDDDKQNNIINNPAKGS